MNGPEADGLTGPGRPEPDLAARDRQVPRRRNHAIKLDRAAIHRRGRDFRVDSRLDRRRLGDGGQRPGQPDRQQLALLVGGGLEALRRVTGVWISSA